MAVPKPQITPDGDPPQHPIAAWLDANGRTQDWLAIKLGITPASMSRLTRGLTMPRPHLALRIEVETGVTVTDLARAKARRSPIDRANRIRQAQNLIARGSSILGAITEDDNK